MNTNLITYGAFIVSALLGLGSISALNAVANAAALSEEPTHGSVRVSDDQPDSRLVKLAKLSRAQAEDAALQHTPGKVIGTELEEENQFLVWQVEVLAKDATTKELTIDAGNGKVLAMEQGDEKHHYMDRGDDAEETASDSE